MTLAGYMKRSREYAPVVPLPLGNLATQAPSAVPFRPSADPDGDMPSVGDRIIFAINMGKYRGTVVDASEKGLTVRFDGSDLEQLLFPSMFSRISFEPQEDSLTGLFGTFYVGDRFYMFLPGWAEPKYGVIERVTDEGAIVHFDGDQNVLYSVSSSYYHAFKKVPTFLGQG